MHGVVDVIFVSGGSPRSRVPGTQVPGTRSLITTTIKLPELENKGCDMTGVHENKALKDTLAVTSQELPSSLKRVSVQPIPLGTWVPGRGTHVCQTIPLGRGGDRRPAAPYHWGGGPPPCALGSYMTRVELNPFSFEYEPVWKSLNC